MDDESYRVGQWVSRGLSTTRGVYETDGSDNNYRRNAKESHLRLDGHVTRSAENSVPKTVLQYDPRGMRPGSRSKERLLDRIKDLATKHLNLKMPWTERSIEQQPNKWTLRRCGKNVMKRLLM